MTSQASFTYLSADVGHRSNDDARDQKEEASSRCIHGIQEEEPEEGADGEVVVEQSGATQQKTYEERLASAGIPFSD